MKRVIDSKKAEDFASSTYDTNFLHKNDTMWEKNGVPAIVPGLQSLFTSLSTINKEELLGINSVVGHFTSIIPVGSEVDFTSETKKGISRLYAKANQNESLGEKTLASIAEKTGSEKRMSFYEGNIPLSIRVNDSDLSTFQELTEMPYEAVPTMYAVAISTASIAEKINNPTTPSWMTLNREINSQDDKKIQLPTYCKIEFYLPGGVRGYESRNGLIQRSAIKADGLDYIIDTICHDGDRILCGVRSTLKLRSKRMIIRAIRNVLLDLEKSGNTGTLEETIKKMKFLKNQD